MIGVKTSIFVQPTGIDYERFQDLDPALLEERRTHFALKGKRVLITVSRLSTEKNIDFLLDAMAELKARKVPPFQLLIIGDGHERHRLQQRIDQENLNDCVTLVGAVPPDDMPLYYRLGDLFVFASKSETQGMVILEAMAAEMPVVAVRSSGIDDVIIEGENGYKTPENLDVWCRQVATMLEDEPHRKALAERAHHFARHHSTDAFARNVHRIYSWLLAAHYQDDDSEQW